MGGSGMNSFRLNVEPLRRVIPLAWAILLLIGIAPAHADAGKTVAEQLLGLRNEARQFEHGEGVRKDVARAVKLYCEAARLGDSEAQFSLGWIYANGRGLPRNDELAAYFFSLAAKQGHAQADKMLRYTGTPASKVPDCMFDIDGRDAFPNASLEQKKVIELVTRIAPEYGIYPRFALAIIRAESNFNPKAVSPKNAQGLMQLIPETSARFNVKKPFDPEQNIRGGLAYLRWLLAYFKGDIELVAAAYNSGERTVDRYAGIPPFAETQGYVKKIKEVFKKSEHPYDPAVIAPSSDLQRIRSARRT